MTMSSRAEAGGSVSAVFDAVCLQGDVFGDDTDYEPDGLESVGGALRLGWRDAARGSAGLVASFNRQDPGGSDLDTGARA